MKKWTLINILLVGWLLLASLTLFAQGNPTEIEYLTTADGLSFDAVTTVAQDSKGFLWIGTQDGLNKYNGYEFEIFRHQPKDSLSISSNRINCLYIDENDLIYIGSKGGLSIYNPRTEKFQNFKNDPHNSNSLSDNNIFKIYEDSNHTIWLGTQDGGLNSFDPNTQQFQTYHLTLTSNRDSDEHIIRGILEDKEGDFWVATSGKGLYKMNRKTEKFSKVEVADTVFFDLATRSKFKQKDLDALNDVVNSIVQKKNGELFLLTVGGIRKLDSTKSALKNFMSPKKELGYLNPYALSVDNSDRLWIIGEKGFVYWDESDDTFKHYNQQIEDPKTFEEVNLVKKPFFDKEAAIWFATNSNGLVRIDQNQRGIRPFLPDKHLTDFSKKIITGVTRDHLGQIWFSVYQEGVFRYSPYTKKVEKMELAIEEGQFEQYGVPYPDKRMVESTAFSIFTDSKGTIWAGSAVSIYKFDTIANKFISIFVANQEKKYVFPQYITEDKEGMIWLSSKKVGLARLNPETYELKLFPYNPNGIHRSKNNDAPRFFQAKDGKMWIGTGGGLCVLDPEKDEFYDLYHFKDGDPFILDDKVGACFEDDEGTIWMGSMSNGLISFNPNSENVNYYTTEEGLQGNMVNGVLPDDKNNYWLWADRGLSKFNPKTKAITNYFSNDRVWGQNMAGVAFKDAQEGHLFFGFNTFLPEDLKLDTNPPNIVLTKLSVYNQEGDGTPTMLKGVAYQNEFSFSYLENIFNVQFSALSYKKEVGYDYSYRLVGFSDKWINLGKKRDLTFTNLDPKTYDLQIKGVNAQGSRIAPKSIKITILPPWWKTWWAYTLYGLAAIGSLWWYIRSLNKKLEKEKAFSNKLERINTANQRFVPNDFLQILGKESIEDLKLGDQVATKMTVLFSDIRDYTPLSESMTPEENFKFINAYLGRVGPIIKAHGGFISTYLGDGFMALFVNEPENALKASIAAQKELEDYNRERKITGKRWLKTGMGLNTGELMLGVIGDEHRYESTVISDAVNTASRMEGLTKVFGAAIILSERTLEGLESDQKLLDNGKLSSNSDFAYRYLGKVKVKGKDKALKIYDLYEGETVAVRQLKAQTHLQFEQGIGYYYQREFGKAAECFKQVLAVNESDKAAQYYLDKSVDYIVNGVAADWSGVEEMVMK